MTLEAAAQLLASALMLLQSVSGNPGLPQSARDAAQLAVQSAITQASQAIGKPAVGAHTPSCKIVSDKYNYRVGEVVVFDYSSTNAAKLEFIPNKSSEQVFPIPQGELIGMHGQYRKVVEKTGYPFITLKATGNDGQSTTCSAMVYAY